MHSFEYSAPNSLEEAINIASKYEGKAMYLAGGTDLFVQIKNSIIKPQIVIDLKKISYTQGVEVSEKEINIGALTTLRAVETSLVIQEKLPLLAQSAGKLGSMQVRNRATIGGNLCNAAPSAETAPALLALEAKAEILSNTGIKNIELIDFFKGPRQTILANGEILKSLRIPISCKPRGSVYYKLSNRRAMDIAFVNIAILVELDREKIKKVRIALGAVAATPFRVTEVESLLEGTIFTEDIAKKAAKLAAHCASPITDLRASKEYRREMVNQLCYQGLLFAYSKAKVEKRCLNGTCSN